MVALFSLTQTIFVAAQTPRFGVGVRGGVARLDGDVDISPARVEISGVFSYALLPHLSLGGQVGFTDLALGAKPDTAILRMMPAALNLTLRFAPYNQLTPFVTLGAGGVRWKHFHKSTHKAIPLSGNKESDFDYFLHTAGGLDITLSPRLSWTVGAAYRYGLADDFDALSQGDKNDAVISAFTGFTINIGKISGDADHDGVSDRYDLNSKVSEDRDGYLDHDGVPDKHMSAIAANVYAEENNGGNDKVQPIVIHKPPLHATAGRKLRLHAEIFENRNLRTVAIIYRPANIRNWLMAPMNAVKGKLYVGTIPDSSVQRAGLEYCVVAVDAALSGVGYSGLPSRPNFVRVHAKETGWRIVSGLAAAAGWGAASYLVFRK
jgi:opacity protein-like surface antigen